MLDQIDWADSGSVLFQTSGWITAAAQAVFAKSNAEVLVLLTQKQGAPVPAIPLAISRVAGVRVAKLLGDPLSQYSDTGPKRMAHSNSRLRLDHLAGPLS
jgi:CelD/BcsL family acetyltransferase involved in cellulose biosynthesis